MARGKQNGSAAPARLTRWPGLIEHYRRFLPVDARTPVVTVTGSPAELTLWALGRTSAAQVRMDGSEAAVRTLSDDHWRH